MPDYEAIQSERLYEKIVGQIESRIMAGELKLGDHLPSERELAEQFRVSRTAVREAVKTLAEKGLVQVRPGRGTFITNSTSEAVRHSLGLLLKIGQPEGSRHLVEVREIFEPEIAALAALRASDEQIAAMREAVGTMDAALDDGETFIEGDLDFHLALAEASQNALIPALIDSIVDLLREQRMAIFRVAGGPQRGQNHHKRILEAVSRHDPESARAAMRAHLRQVRDDTGASTNP
jgi:GntR family transcriptional regulator, transcriptional repressor for pyruvate dehydrogenase complex